MRSQQGVCSSPVKVKCGVETGNNRDAGMYFHDRQAVGDSVKGWRGALKSSQKKASRWANYIQRYNIIASISSCADISSFLIIDFGTSSYRQAYRKAVSTYFARYEWYCYP